MARKNLGELLRDQHVVEEDDLKAALAVQRKSGERLGSTLVRLGKIDESVLVRMLGEQHEVEGINPLRIEPQREAVHLLDLTTAMRLGALPLWIRDGSLGVALADPSDRDIITELEHRTGLTVKTFVAPQMLLYAAIKTAYSNDRETREDAVRDVLRKALGRLQRVVADLEELLGE